MTASLQKTFVIAISVIVMLFLLFDGGSMIATTVAGDMANTNLFTSHTWIWVLPTLLIFGLGFLLAWILFGKDDDVSNVHDMRIHAAKGRVVQDSACYWERIDDPHHVSTR